jgi:hypothetical protein
MPVLETTTEEQRKLGMRTFMLRGQQSRCQVQLAWEEEVDFTGAPEWKPLPAAGNRLVIEELLSVITALHPVAAGGSLPE